MAKTICAYRGFTASCICARAEVPAQSNMSVSSTCVNACNITMSSIKNAIGAGSYALSGLATCACTAEWSGFSPHNISISNYVLSMANPTTNYSMGSFAGYNHTPVTPTFDHIYYTANVVTGNPATFDGYVYIGELNYPYPATAVVMTIWDGGTLVATGFAALSSATDGVVFLTAETPNLTSNKTFVVKFFIGDSTTEFQQNMSNALCYVPNTSTSGYERTIIVGQSGGAVTYQGDSNWGVWNIGNTYKPSSVSAFETTTGTIELVILGSVTNSNQQISAYVTGTGVTNGSLDIFKSSRDVTYDANTQINFSQYIGSAVMNDWTMTITFGDEN